MWGGGVWGKNKIKDAKVLVRIKHNADVVGGMWWVGGWVRGYEGGGRLQTVPPCGRSGVVGEGHDVVVGIDHMLRLKTPRNRQSGV